jgi:hypothetical protein
MSFVNKLHALKLHAYFGWISFLVFNLMVINTGLNGQCVTTTAYSTVASSGNVTTTSERVGLSFTVTQTVKVNALGAFDDSGDGFSTPVSVGMLNAAGGTVIAPVVFNGLSGFLTGNFRMLPVTPVTLTPGVYWIVATGYNAANPFGEEMANPFYPSVTGNGSVSINFMGHGFGGAGFGLPETRNTTESFKYHAASFNYNTGIPPVIQCAKNIEVDLPPLACGEKVFFNNPAQQSGCPLVSMNQILSLPSGSVFPVGIHTVTFQASDAFSNTATCSFTITINDYQAPPLGCKDVQISLDGDCQGELSPTTVLTGWEGPSGSVLLGCLDFYDINVTGPNGEALGNTLGFDQLNKTLPYTITHPDGLNCWGYVSVEDKIKPVVLCSTRPIEVNCLTDISSIPPPDVDDNCFARAVLVNEVHQMLQCDPLYIGKITRYWKAVDASGNESDVCSEMIMLLRPNTNGVTMPGNQTLEACSGYAVDDRGQGFPSPAVTGVPMLGTKRLYPNSQLNMVFCNSLIDYIDQPIVQSGCKTKILRTWTITEWWCSTSVKKVMGMQMIDILDTTGPSIPQVNSYTITTSSRKCATEVTLPALNITDNCNEVYNVYVNISPSGYLPTNGGKIELSAGSHSITYTAFDNCGNASSMTYRITVRDQTDPVAVCDFNTTVSLNPDGYTKVTAAAVDDGSFDECGPVSLKIKKMNADECGTNQHIGWHDTLSFCCLNAGAGVMVQLQVLDAGQNENICMVSVRVQDKIDPSITCPHDVTVNCDFTFDPANLDDYFGEAQIFDNCPATNTLRQRFVNNRNQCGSGSLNRTFEVVQGATVYQTCSQTITFVNPAPFNPEKDITWPPDFTSPLSCGPDQLLPERLSPPFDRPVITEDACDMVAMRYEDEVYPFTEQGACLKILRTWEVIDWCQQDLNGNPLSKTYVQELKIMNSTRPVITVPLAAVIKTLDCAVQQVSFGATATDDCTPSNELKWRHEIYHNGVFFRTGMTRQFTYTCPIGLYKTYFWVEDKCGNMARDSFSFEIETTKPPVAVCVQGLALPLVNMGGVAMASVTPSFFDNKSYHPCNYDFDLSFSPTSLVSQLDFTCDDIGIQDVTVWFTDEKGNQSSCNTFVEVQDIDGICPPNTNPVLVGVNGRITKDDGKNIASVAVIMEGAGSTPVLTDANGIFVFTPMPAGGAYDITPSRDGDDLNGVSTLDIIMIQRHILGVEKINSPYRLIAADANSSGSVTAADLTDLRKLVLGVYNELPKNSSWRFVDAAYKFPDPSNPWNGSFPEKYPIANLNANIDLAFTGIKIGDINGSAVAGSANAEQVERRSAFSLVVNDRFVEAGEKIILPVFAGSKSFVHGLQMRLALSGLEITGASGGLMNLNIGDHAFVKNEFITVSTHQTQPVIAETNDVLFELTLIATRSGMLRDLLSISADYSNQVYDEVLETMDVKLVWRHAGKELTMQKVTPNPWSTLASLTFDLPAEGYVTLKVRDFAGRSVANMVDFYTEGLNTIQVTRNEIPNPGVYIYEIRFGNEVLTGKMIVLE